MRKKIIAVIGGHSCSKEVGSIARKFGERASELADFIICGGTGGVMLEVCKGFKSKGGITIGIIPGYDKDQANPFVDIIIPSGLGLARNVLVVKSADVVVALPGESGTLSEIAYCLQFAVPVIALLPQRRGKQDSLTAKVLHKLNEEDIPGVIKTRSVEEAIKKAVDFLNRRKHEGDFNVGRRNAFSGKSVRSRRESGKNYF